MLSSCGLSRALCAEHTLRLLMTGCIDVEHQPCCYRVHLHVFMQLQCFTCMLQLLVYVCFGLCV
jgi:hypothetical protein